MFAAANSGRPERGTATAADASARTCIHQTEASHPMLARWLHPCSAQIRHERPAVAGQQHVAAAMPDRVAQRAGISDVVRCMQAEE